MDAVEGQRKSRDEGRYLGGGGQGNFKGCQSPTTVHPLGKVYPRGRRRERFGNRWRRNYIRRSSV